MAHDMFKIIEETRETIPTRYNLNVTELQAIMKDASSSNGTFGDIAFNAIGNAFYYGFAMGRRYERNQSKKEG